MKKRVLITDDDPGIQDIFKLIFERAGYDAIILSSGRQLLENGYPRPDIFLLDKQLSGIDGLDICRHLKSQSATKNIPVIMVSATPGLDLLAKQAGADDFIEKPFRTQELLAVVEKHLK